MGRRLGGLVVNLRAQDEHMVGPAHRSNSLYDSWWAIAVVLFAHIPLGMLPHIGNKVWALKNDGDRMRFVKLAFAVGLTMGMMASAAFSPAAFSGRASGCRAQPERGATGAVHRTVPDLAGGPDRGRDPGRDHVDGGGLVVSSSQIVANDIYRRSIVPKYRSHLSDEEVDRKVLGISRWSTVIVLILCTGMAWAMQDMTSHSWSGSAPAA